MKGSLEVDPVVTSFVRGRLRDAEARPVVELWIDGAFERAESLEEECPEPLEFRIPIPFYCFDAQEHAIEIRYGRAICGQAFRSAYSGYLDSFGSTCLTGWVDDAARPGVPLEVEFHLNGVPVGRKLANVFREEQFHGFEFELPRLAGEHNSFVARACVAGTDINLQGSPVVSLARPRLLRTVQQFSSAFRYLEQRLTGGLQGGRSEVALSQEEQSAFAAHLFEGAHVADLLEIRRRFIDPMQAQFAANYARRDYASLGASYPGAAPRRARSAPGDRPVDVIVPLYSGNAETERCLESVLKAPGGCRYQLFCVLDNPNNAELRELAERLAARDSRVRLYKNAESKGFAESVNMAMRLHGDRDVLILHSDCEVHGDWLGRLQLAAYAGQGAGLVNPLTNQGEYLSYPSAGVCLPPGISFETMDRFARSANQGATVRLPAAAGFCLYIRRDCLNDLGLFHNDEQGAGYYAEKYFSVNAAARGWQSILAADVFVGHHGYRSFVERDAAAIERARNAFTEWCPFYEDSVTDFLVDDPVLPAKRALDIARMENAGRQRFCFIAHGAGGGVERHMRELSETLSSDSLSAITIYSLPGSRVHISVPEMVGIENLFYRLETEWNELVRDLRRLSIRHVHIHSNVEVDRRLFTLPAELSAPYDITVHDYAWFCPRVNLVNQSGVYCGEPPAHVCGSCAGTDVAALIEESRACLQGARRVLCPSEDARQRMERHFDLSNISVRPHPEWFSVTAARERGDAAKPATVAIIGRISTHKGLRVVRQCAEDAMEKGLPLRFAVIGSTTDDRQFEGLTNVEITGAYQEGEVDGLIRKCGAAIALLPSVWPETYSYTLSIALRNGLFTVAFDLGAIAERLRLSRTGTLLPLGTPAATINEALLLASQSRSVPKANGARYADILTDYYGLPRCAILPAL